MLGFRLRCPGLRMNACCRRSVLQIAIALWILVCGAKAQDSSEHVLPDAPVPVGAKTQATSIGKQDSQRGTAQVLPGMSAKQKYALAYRRIVSPQTLLKAGFVSSWEVGTGLGPDYPTNGWKPFAKRFGYNAASISTTIFFNTALVPALAHQDPRYFRKPEAPMKERIRWAIKSEFVGVGDDGDAMPNYANLVGEALASVAENAFGPSKDISVGDMAQGYSIKIGFGMGFNVAREFDVFGHLKGWARHSKIAGE